MMSPAEIKPFNLFQMIFKLLVNNPYRSPKHVRALLAHSVKMQAVNTRYILVRKRVRRHSHSRKPCARVIYFCFLFRIFGIYTKSALKFFLRYSHPILVSAPISGRIKNNMVGVFYNTVNLVRPVRRRENVYFAVHILASQTCFKQRA